MRVEIPHRMGQFSGLSSIWNSIGSLCCGVGSKMDLSVLNNGRILWQPVCSAVDKISIDVEHRMGCLATAEPLVILRWSAFFQRLLFTPFALPILTFFAFSFKFRLLRRCRRWCRCRQQHWGIRATWTTIWSVSLRRWFQHRAFTSWWPVTLRWLLTLRHAVFCSYTHKGCTLAHCRLAYINIYMALLGGHYHIQDCKIPLYAH